MEKTKLDIETKIKLNKFQARGYQLPIFDAIENKEYKRVLCIMPRRAGKDITAFNLMLRQALKTIGVYYYVFPTYSQAKKVIWDAITNSGDKFLDYIPSELVVSKNSQEMKLTLKNDSLIQLVGSDRIDSLVGTNPRGVVFSEYAIQSPLAYQFLRPILLANDGWALFISCVAPNTLVIGEKGLKRIESVSSSREEYSELNEEFYGLGGFHNAKEFYCGGKQKTLKITLSSGYEIECTPIHPLWSGREWVKAQELKVGDEIPIQYGQNVWGEGLDISDDFIYKSHGHSKEFPFGLENDDFFYFLGLFHADGNYDKNKVCITNKKDEYIKEFVKKYGFKTRKDGIHHELSNKELCALLEFLGFKHGAKNKTFPDRLFECTKKQLKCFIQGLFDGDGCSSSDSKKYGRVKFTSTCKGFVQDLQVILLNFGIVSSVRREDKGPTKLVKYASVLYNLEINGHFSHIFFRDIGFRLDRKQKNWKYVPKGVQEDSNSALPIDVTKLKDYCLPKNLVTNSKRMGRRLINKLYTRKPHPYLKELLNEKLFYSKIKSIEPSINEVFDFVIPETHSFFSNGFISHNTPRGKNHMWELYNIAQQSEDWFVYKLSVEDTQHISISDIEKERREGLMSDDLIEQEYYCSFNAGVEGAYYSKYINKMRLNGQISVVPWEPTFLVHTAWDLGVNDPTAIIFFQISGQVVRIIDCYQKSDEGLAHFVSYIKSKEYTYGKHFAPHDIQVREWGTALTRYEQARRMGLKFTPIIQKKEPLIPLEDGIECVRASLSKIWIDEHKCKELIRSIENYRQEYDQKRKVYKPKPLHNWASHYADSLRYLCLSLPKTQDGMTPEDIDRNYRKAVYGTDMELPAFFRDQTR